MIRVTHIIAGLDPDGAEKMLQRLIAGMDSSRFENEVISLTEFRAHGAKDSGLRRARSRVGNEARKRQSVLSAATCRMAAEIAAAGGPDLDVSRRSGRRDCARLAGLSSGCLEHPSQRIASGNRQALTPSGPLERARGSRGDCRSESFAARKRRATFHANLGYASDRMQVIPNGFDLDRFKSDPRQRRCRPARHWGFRNRCR